MHVLLIGQIFRCGQRATRRQDTFHNRIARQIAEHDDARQNAGFLKAAAKIISHVIFNTHRRKHYAETSRVLSGKPGLTRDLHGKLIVRHARTRKNRQFLSADQRNQHIDRRNARTNIVSRISPRDRIDRKTVDIAPEVGIYRSQTVRRTARPVEHAA